MSRIPCDYLSAGRAASYADQKRRFHLGRCSAAVAGRFRQAIADVLAMGAHRFVSAERGGGWKKTESAVFSLENCTGECLQIDCTQIGVKKKNCFSRLFTTYQRECICLNGEAHAE